jgi:hypothetical protein
MSCYQNFYWGKPTTVWYFNFTTKKHKGAGIAQSVYRLATVWTTEGSEFKSWYGQEFSLVHVVQTGSGAHPVSYPMSPGGSFPEEKRQGREADHSPPTSVEVKKMWIYMFTPPYAFMA